MKGIDVFHNIEKVAYPKGYSITSLCKALGMSPAVLFDLKYGRKDNLSALTIEKLCAFLDCTPNDIIGEIDSPVPDKPKSNALAEQVAAQLNERAELRRLVRIAMKSSDKTLRIISMMLEDIYANTKGD